MTAAQFFSTLPGPDWQPGWHGDEASSSLLSDDQIVHDHWLTVHSGTFQKPQPLAFFQRCCCTNGRHTGVRIGGILQYELEVLRGLPFFKAGKPGRRSDANGGHIAVQIGVYCSTFRTRCMGWGLRNIAHTLWVQRSRFWSPRT